MGLVEFEKIIMMDIDMLVTANVDDLFHLPAPAAMSRGMHESYWAARHGDPLDGRRFFSKRRSGKSSSWGQGTGINAGVMLWQPSDEVLADMLQELEEPVHPAHVRGNGPEQDYLSRYWADAPWTNMGCEYNYQLHQMFNALHPDFVKISWRTKLSADPSRIKIIHYSGETAAKPWHRVLDKKLAHLWPDRGRDAEHAQLMAEEFLGYFLWIRRERACWDKHVQTGYPAFLYGFELSDEGAIVDTREQGKRLQVELPEWATEGAMRTLRHSMAAWFDAFTALERSIGIDVVAALVEADPKTRRRKNG
ncbi:unnamed protein product, partial [Prorocentrum cordatum]